MYKPVNGCTNLFIQRMVDKHVHGNEAAPVHGPMVLSSFPSFHRSIVLTFDKCEEKKKTFAACLAAVETYSVMAWLGRPKLGHLRWTVPPACQIFSPGRSYRCEICPDRSPRRLRSFCTGRTKAANKRERRYPLNITTVFLFYSWQCFEGLLLGRNKFSWLIQY